jgi:hypothetical protein
MSMAKPRTSRSASTPPTDLIRDQALAAER